MSAAVLRGIVESDIRPPERPHSVEAEQAILGGLLIDPAKWKEVEGLICDADFYRSDHRIIFSALEQLAAAGKPFDAVLVVEALRQAGKLEETGGLAYLGQLARETPTADNIPLYAETVAERSRLRRLQDLGTTIEGAVADRFTSSQITTSLRAVLDQMPDAGTASQREHRPALEWAALSSQEPPERSWAIQKWLGRGHVTLMSGDGGAGKSLLGQAAGSCLALRRSYLDWVPEALSVLAWFCEDSEEELWRRQIAIARWLAVPLADFSDRFHAYAYDGEDVELAGAVHQRLCEAPRLEELRQQIGDLKPGVVVLDNVARLYGGNENDRHQVTTFVSLLARSAVPSNAAILLLGHPGKAAGSEYSGSTAWEGSVRARLYLGRTLPGARTGDGDEDEAAPDDGVRYLARRKANYSDRDWRRLQIRDGVMIPDAAPDERQGTASKPGDAFAADTVERAVLRLAAMGEHGVASSNSPKYLPRLAREYKLLDRLTEKQFANAMRSMRTDGRLVVKVVGRYSNRSPREGLALPEEAQP